jgi:hypothetical protein
MSDLALKRKRVLELEAAMNAMPEHRIEIPIEHYFAPGIYMRQMTMPANATVVGKIHKSEHYCILSQGKVSVVTDEGTKTLEAPAVVHSLPGAKRALYAHTQVVWINVHHNPENERDTDKIEERLIAKSFEELESFMESQKLIEQGGSKSCHS